VSLPTVYHAVDGHEQSVMIFSCGDRKPSDHLGIKIRRIGLPLLGLYPQMNAEQSGSRKRRWMARLSSDAPEPLLTEHLEGAQAILIFRVANLETAMKDH
jgi:hypothetical protein